MSDDLPKHQQRMMEARLRQIADVVRDLCPPGIGFALVIFDFMAPGTMSYMSNAVREDVVRMFRELADKIERQ